MPFQLGNVTTYHLHEISEAFKITLRTLREKCKTGELPARKIGSQWIVEESALRSFFNPGPGDPDQGDQLPAA